MLIYSAHQDSLQVQEPLPVPTVTHLKFRTYAVSETLFRLLQTEDAWAVAKSSGRWERKLNPNRKASPGEGQTPSARKAKTKPANSLSTIHTHTPHTTPKKEKHQKMPQPKIATTTITPHKDLSNLKLLAQGDVSRGPRQDQDGTHCLRDEI